MQSNIKAAIFDLDGTLIDSMWVWEKIDVDYLKNKGFELPYGLRDEIEHLSFDETAIYFKKRFNISDSLEKIKMDWNDMAYKEYSNNIKLKPGVENFLSKLKKNNIKIGLATSNYPSLLNVVLKNNGIFDYFDSITTTNEVSRGKDYPDVYLLAAKKLNEDPKSCIVFEDILPAVKGATLAGMRVIGIMDNSSCHNWSEMSKLTYKFIKDFTELEAI
ncbi:HAD family hydrolase [Clostridium oryzae]|uniref:2-deoxyglucose-6-phosphate phosphatase n=1 Tax=Clostridium oryzae TaxID=1450648 RepID=A0A1V4I6C4_9CLOT|nr:HAD family phosphatase [Clostridium oryzae]OPJ55503.1 2-deoxyglucose-6-phosphate phosphatase [Clostridium oryzae]